VSDLDVREKQREAAINPGAQEDYDRASRRNGLEYDGAFAHMVGRWVIVNQIIHHWRGRIIKIVREPYMPPVAYMHPQYELEGYWGELPQDRAVENTSEEYPGIVMLGASTSLRLQDAHWPEVFCPVRE